MSKHSDRVTEWGKVRWHRLSRAVDDIAHYHATIDRPNSAETTVDFLSKGALYQDDPNVPSRASLLALYDRAYAEGSQ